MVMKIIVSVTGHMAQSWYLLLYFSITQYVFPLPSTSSLAVLGGEVTHTFIPNGSEPFATMLGLADPMDFNTRP